MISSYNSSDTYCSSSVLASLVEKCLSTLVVVRMARVLTLLIAPILGLSGLVSLIFRDFLDECSAGTSSYDQVTLAGEAGALSRDFASDVMLVASVRDGQVYDPPSEDILVMTSSPGRLLPQNPASELVESDLIKF